MIELKPPATNHFRNQKYQSTQIRAINLFNLKLTLQQSIIHSSYESSHLITNMSKECGFWLILNDLKRQIDELFPKQRDFVDRVFIFLNCFVIVKTLQLSKSFMWIGLNIKYCVAKWFHRIAYQRIKREMKDYIGLNVDAKIQVFFIKFDYFTHKSQVFANVSKELVIELKLRILKKIKA